ncbi:hypothetical protein BCV70DRAFT_207587 [Testicularia cyperi]|uniref:Uncharacterized protein n=1 Tax=Testicularia cyperi TaxID=1882483 RepID=A0A317XM24_9BASI|nr:hypothetical protein BCV70DRAFT_207587 [Testicularia cyperi]
MTALSTSVRRRSGGLQEFELDVGREGEPMALNKLGVRAVYFLSLSSLASTLTRACPLRRTAETAPYRKGFTATQALFLGLSFLVTPNGIWLYEVLTLLSCKSGHESSAS